MRRFEKLWQRDEKLTFLIFTKLKGKKEKKNVLFRFILD